MKQIETRPSRPKVGGRGPAPEWPVHGGLYLLLAAAGALRAGPGLLGWEGAIGLMALCAALALARQWASGSRLLLLALVQAAVSAQVGMSPDAAGLHWAALASSQAQILLMVTLTVMGFLAFALALSPRLTGLHRAGWRCLQGSVVVGLGALVLRWLESYRLGPHLGHVPISNLYEVMVLFVVVCGLLQLKLLEPPRLRGVAPLLSLVSVAACAFLVWYAMYRGADQIQPLVPALDSYWMKLHVPANFVGYGAFCLAAMLGLARLLADRPRLRPHLPEPATLELAMHRLIGLGFAFFTLATILGSLWAAEAWGGYWSWDPKETWALIVWLNYAAWLHMRLVKGYGGRFIAWWALLGLLVTLFAFLGVNMYLAGLHSYGSL